MCIRYSTMQLWHVNGQNLEYPHGNNMGIKIDNKIGNGDAKKLQCVSKNIPDILSCNFRKQCRIFILFGIHVTEKVSNQ